MTMPVRVSDDHADVVLAQITAIYERTSPFVLFSETAGFWPHHLPQFLTAYLCWSKENHALQQRYCRGAIRIESNDAMHASIICNKQLNIMPLSRPPIPIMW
ncbi:MAG: hypothetical protein ACSLEN_11155 [Candidatus Malihini olakiniferum]